MKLPPVAKRQLGEEWHLTYYLIFPDNDMWVDQVQIAHDIQHEMKNWKFCHGKPGRQRDMIEKGETKWEVKHGSLGECIHIARIENIRRERRWGTPTQRMKEKFFN